MGRTLCLWRTTVRTTLWLRCVNIDLNTEWPYGSARIGCCFTGSKLLHHAASLHVMHMQPPGTTTEPLALADDLRLVRKNYLLKHFLPVSPSTFNRWISTGKFPAGVLVSKGIRVWPLWQVKQWLTEKRS